MEDLGSSYESQNEQFFRSDSPAARAFASLGDALRAAEVWMFTPSSGVVYTAEGIETPATTEWAAYLAAVDVNDERTPGQRLAAYFA